MKNLIILLFLSLFIFSIGLKANSALTEKQTSLTNVTCDHYVTVLKIVDGDTFIGLTKGRKKVYYRLPGVDAPEKNQPFSEKSKKKLKKLIKGRLIGIKKQENSERYGRSMVRAYTLKGKDVSAEMLKSGLAWHFWKYDKSAIYSQLENEARKIRKGLWSEVNPISPWDFRKTSKKPFLKRLR